MRGLLLLIVAWGIACVAPRGGWDVGALRAAEPRLEELRGQRLGDLTPFPAWIEGRLLLVVCRWPAESPVVVRGSAQAPVPEEWLRAAVTAIDRSVTGAEVELSSAAQSREASQAPRNALAQGGVASDAPAADVSTALRQGAGVRVIAVPGDAEEGPAGVGDTLALCDVSPRADRAGLARGELQAAEIQIRSARADLAGRMQPLLPEEWVGALMHELGHALGFAGHAATGDSILVREQGVLRARGRRALAGGSRSEPTLEALYRLEPGRILGQRELAPSARSWFMRLEDALEDLEQAGVGLVGPWASVGDRQARLEWRLEGGGRARILFPSWARQLRAGGLIFALPDATTRGWLERRAAQSPSERSRARARATH